MNPSAFATDICVLRGHARLGNAVLVAMALAAPVAAQQPEPSPPTIYSFSLGYAPSGAIVTARDSVNGNWSYSYDPVNRLAAAARSGPALTFEYDRNGNRWRQTSLDGQGPSPQYDFDTRSNHIVGMTYDALGNIINDGFHTYAYDAENRLIKVDGGITAEYAYDALGRRVRKASANGAATEYLYDLDGRVAAERDGPTGSWNRAEVYAAGRHVATYARDTTYFHHQDWLGSNRVTTLPDGSLAEQCTNLPFGDRQICVEVSGQAATATPFADYERDRETQLDHTWFRKYSSTQGRWTTPDPYLGSMDPPNPQSLNRYAYVLNDPLNIRDPFGLDGVCIIKNKDGINEEVDAGAKDEATCTKHGGTWYATKGGVGDGGGATARDPGAWPPFWSVIPPPSIFQPHLSRPFDPHARTTPEPSDSPQDCASSSSRLGNAGSLFKVPNAGATPEISGTNLPFHLRAHPWRFLGCLVRNDVVFGALLGGDWTRCIQESRGEAVEEEMPLYHEPEVETYKLEYGPGNCRLPPIRSMR